MTHPAISWPTTTTPSLVLPTKPMKKETKLYASAERSTLRGWDLIWLGLVQAGYGGRPGFHMSLGHTIYVCVCMHTYVRTAARRCRPWPTGGTGCGGSATTARRPRGPRRAPQVPGRPAAAHSCPWACRSSPARAPPGRWRRPRSCPRTPTRRAPRSPRRPSRPARRAPRNCCRFECCRCCCPHRPVGPRAAGAVVEATVLTVAAKGAGSRAGCRRCCCWCLLMVP